MSRPVSRSGSFRAAPRRRWRDPSMPAFIMGISELPYKYYL
ncbi:hypothetical protein CEV33_2007 [Brucella grignonensis]|uniref:Uncharacterized protein n=1 Tax=Brucella grignonensis TaxID=94627 RepID=A0A256F6Q8_9HYPH|nr:hypothetical protein CEV33_2007 [Brucella grignonensis]